MNYSGEKMDKWTLASSANFILPLLAVLLFAFLSLDALSLMVHQWESDEYNHGYMIPIVALYLAWQKRAALITAMEPGSLVGYVIFFIAICGLVVGEVSSIYVVIQYSFVVAVLGAALVVFGRTGVREIWAAIFYLIFMIPLPNFLYASLSQELQLISSALGVAVIRLFDISVFLEGNVIDLGVYQLQVVEACSGLRYLFPLMSFGFLIAYIYRGPMWQKIAIFLSTLPITVLMNSFRIGVIGVTVEYFGIGAAEGFLHDFEGWFVFMACLGVLLLEIWMFTLFSRKRMPVWEFLDLDFGGGDANKRPPFDRGNKNLGKIPFVALATVFTAIAAFPLSTYIDERPDRVPERSSFDNFPLAYSGWIGSESTITDEELEVLKLTDYFIGAFRKIGSEAPPVGFYTAWYREQRKGASIHSPRSCLPGGGWEIQHHTIESIDFSSSSRPFKVNRVVMQMGDVRQLAYYWFQGRNRITTSEYLAKWYIFEDSMLSNRTDGALVRLITFVPEGGDIADADARLKEFFADTYVHLQQYIPD